MFVDMLKHILHLEDNCFWQLVTFPGRNGQFCVFGGVNVTSPLPNINILSCQSLLIPTTIIKVVLYSKFIYLLKSMQHFQDFLHEIWILVNLK